MVVDVFESDCGQLISYGADGPICAIIRHDSFVGDEVLEELFVLYCVLTVKPRTVVGSIRPDSPFAE